MQNDLISRSALLKEFEKRQKAAVDGVFADCFLNDAQNLSTEWWMVEDIVEAAPTIDAVEVVRARWVDPCINKYGHPCHHCSACRFKASQKDRNFCPNCGAKMDGGAVDV